MVTRILVGDCRELLPTLDADSVHCVVTSPPYFGLRDYGTAQWDGGDAECDHSIGNQVQDSKAVGAITNGVRPGTDASHCRKCGAVRLDQQIGLESSLEAYITTLVAVFREVRRVLRDDGTLWLVLGDSYSSQGGSKEAGEYHHNTGQGQNRQSAGQPSRNGVEGFKPKDLMLVPARVALALQADGWYLRSDIIWHKPNPMPESVTDRPTSSHEHVFLLTKQARYFYDAEAVREPATDYTPNTNGRTRNVGGRNDGYTTPIGNVATPEGGRNLRNVWTIATYALKEAHFATFPPALVAPCLKAGTSERGCCAACGAPWVRVVERGEPYKRLDSGGRVTRLAVSDAGQGTNGTGKTTLGRVPTGETLGWQPPCRCDAGAPIPCTVLDPFGGAGTVGLVADRLGRNAVLIELNPAYASMSQQRIIWDAPLFTNVLM